MFQQLDLCEYFISFTELQSLCFYPEYLSECPVDTLSFKHFILVLAIASVILIDSSKGFVEKVAQRLEVVLVYSGINYLNI